MVPEVLIKQLDTFQWSEKLGVVSFAPRGHIPVNHSQARLFNDVGGRKTQVLVRLVL